MTKLGCVAAHVCCKYCKKHSYDGCLVRSAWQVHTISAGVGNVSKYDVDMAAATGAMIIGFGINVPGSVMKQAELQSIDIYREKVDIEVKEIPTIHGVGVQVVYHVVDHAKMLLGKLLPLAVKYDLQGSADVLQVTDDS